MPKSAFRDADHQQEFVTTAKRFQAGAGVITANGASPVAALTGAPWWRNRSAVDAATTDEETVLRQRQF